jgi:hypothetical protein
MRVAQGLENIAEKTIVRPIITMGQTRAELTPQQRFGIACARAYDDNGSPSGRTPVKTYLWEQPTWLGRNYTDQAVRLSSDPPDAAKSALPNEVLDFVRLFQTCSHLHFFLFVSLVLQFIRQTAGSLVGIRKLPKSQLPWRFQDPAGPLLFTGSNGVMWD